ncbi:MAG TPA: LLM class flavin-dependent oxidoreductase [Ktedonobacteraceae bacterium]|nr:LLM class flavin-dependent oxidoreductase [Ktedonobacteraceae bacterium]
MAPIQFGWALNASPVEGMTPSQFTQAVQQQIQRVEAYIDSLWFVDHVQFGDSPLLEGWTALTYLAAQYPQFHIGHMVLCQSFRNPALLAKMAATLQYLSNGRFIFGIGAGWHEEEYRAYGYEFPSARTRVEQLEETLQIVKALWSERQVTYRGRYFSVNAAFCEPKPDPVPPILVGGKRTRMLQLTARYADGWNAAWLSPEEYKQGAGILEQECRKIGRDPAQIQRSWFGRCVCVSSREEARALEGSGLLGTPEQIVEQLQTYIDLGIRSFMLGSRNLSDTTTVELLAREVLPQVKS